MHDSTARPNRLLMKLAPLALVTGSFFVAGNALAQAVVTDPAHTQLTMAGWIKELASQAQQYAQQIKQYQQQVQQYKTQGDQYKQQFVIGDPFKGSPGYREKFTERAVGAGVVEQCGDGPKKNPVGAVQYRSCVAIVQTQNRRFNAMVKVLQDVEKRDEELQAAYKERQNIDEDNEAPQSIQTDSGNTRPDAE